MAKKRTKCWKPGNLVTIKGVVYRVKREPMFYTTCQHCALGHGLNCSFPSEHYEKYPLPVDCYLERESPIMKTFYE